MADTKFYAGKLLRRAAKTSKLGVAAAIGAGVAGAMAIQKASKGVTKDFNAINSKASINQHNVAMGINLKQRAAKKLRTAKAPLSKALPKPKPMPLAPQGIPGNPSTPGYNYKLWK